jgi:hypothetical protein
MVIVFRDRTSIFSIFFVIPFYLQYAPVHSANCVNNVYNGM